MIPRTVLMAQEVVAQLTSPQLDEYGNIILNGYLKVVPNTVNKKAWQYKETTTAPVNLPSLTVVRPAIKGWTTNYYEYYTQLAPNAYNQVPGNPTMFKYGVHSFTAASGPITSLQGLQGGSGYTVGPHLGVPAVGGSGTGATLDVTVGAGGVVVTATISNPGTGYQEGDGLTVTTLGSGTGFSVFVGPIAAPITAIGVISPGSGFTSGTYTGVVTTSSDAGTGATLDIVVDATGQVISAVLNAPGTGYTVGAVLTPTGIGPGVGSNVSVTSVGVANPAGESKWAQPPARYNQQQVSNITPPQNVNNPAVIQYSFVYPVADNPVAPPIDIL